MDAGSEPAHSLEPRIKSHLKEESIMLQSYSAQLKGNQIIWLDQPPVCAPDSRVLVVVETNELPLAPTQKSDKYDLSDLVGHLNWQGDALVVQRQQRDAW